MVNDPYVVAGGLLFNYYPARPSDCTSAPGVLSHR